MFVFVNKIQDSLIHFCEVTECFKGLFHAADPLKAGLMTGVFRQWHCYFYLREDKKDMTTSSTNSEHGRHFNTMFNLC